MLNSRQRQSHPRGQDRERITSARKVAEALFTSKPSTNSPSVPAPAAERRKPRVLQIVLPTPDDRSEAPEVPPVASESSARKTRRSEFARIRTWVKYGMTAAQVAQVYEVAVTDIERILPKT